MTIKLPEKRINVRHNRRPVFVAHVPFLSYDDIPEDLGLNDSPISAHGLRVSEQEYWEKYYEVSDRHYEWNNGVLEEKPVSDYATFKLYKWLFVLIDAFLTAKPIGKLVALETGFRMQFVQRKKVTIRKPDFFVVRNDNPTPYLDNHNSFQGIADLCVEALSDLRKKDREHDTKVKFEEYELAGVHEYYILDAKKAHMTFYRRGDEGRYARIPIGNDEIVRLDVLPGLQFRVSDLFRQPSLLLLTDDPIYQSFVFPEIAEIKMRAQDLQMQVEQERARVAESQRLADLARARAEQEWERAEQQQALAEQERGRADRLDAKLRQLGIDPDQA